MNFFLTSYSLYNEKIIQQMDVTDLKVSFLAFLSITFNVTNFNSLIATVSGVVFLGYGITRWYYLLKNKGK